MMKTYLMTFALMLGLTPLSGSLNAADAPEGSPAFVHSVDEVKAKAVESGKPVILIFSASWCGPCQEMKKAVYPDKVVKPFHEKFEWAYLDIDDEASAKAFEASGHEVIPSFQFLAKDGVTELKKVQGGADPAAFAKLLEEVLAKASE